MIEASVDCVITIDAQSTILEFNAAAERTFGYARAEVIGRPLPEMIIPPSLREAHRRGMAALLKGGTGKLLGKRVEMPAMRADSSEFPVELTITRIASQKPPLFTAYLRDITERKRAEEALRKSEKLFTAFMDHLPGFAWIKDVEGRYVYINETFLQLRNALGKTDAELWPAEIASTYRANDNQVIQTKNTLQTIEPFPKDPEQGCQIVSKFPIFDQDGAVVMVGGASVDISELVQAEKALEVQALRYKTLMETSADSIYVVDAEGNLQEANAAFLRQRGYTAAEVKGLNVADWDARWTRAQLQKRYRKLVGSSAVFETRHRSKDGSLFDVEVSATSVRIGGKELFFCVARDITGRKKAERALGESETRFRQLVENLNEVFWITDLEGSTTYVSPAYERIWGRSCESLYAEPRSWRDAIHPEDRPRMEATFAPDPGSTGDYTYRIVRADGSIRWIRDRGFPVRDENGKVVRFAGIAEDITERQRAEETTAQLAAIVRSSSDAIIGMDLSGIITSWNQGAERIFAYGADEMVGGPIRRLIPADQREEEEQVFSRIRQGENVEHFETAGIEKGGSQIDLSLTVSPIRNAAEDMVGASLVARDITGLKRTQEALRTSEERFRELAENIHEVFWMSDPENTRMIYISPAYEAIWGRTRETLYASPASWVEAIHPEDKERMIRARAHFAQGIPHDNTYRIVRPDSSIRWIRDRGFPVRGEHGVVVRFAGIAEDITERRCAEEELRREKEILAKIFNNIPVMIGFVGTDGSVRLVNPEWVRTIGWTLEELRDQNVDIFAEAYPDLSYRQEVLDFVAAATGDWADLKIKVRSGRVLDVACAVVHLSDGTKVAIAQDITERKRAAEQLEEANRQLRILSRQLFHIQEEERRHLARELHDEIGQTLTAAKINLKIIAPDVPAKISGRLEDSVQLLDRLLRQVRELSLNLRPPLLDELGLVPTLRWLVDQQAQRAGLRVSFNANADDLEIDPDVQTTCFRVAQEAITNVIRHSGAKNLAVDLRRETERLTLTVSDDGAGFDPAVLQQRTTQNLTLGLLSMKERALLARGGFELHSAPGQGTEIRAWFPLPNNEHPSTMETT
jgi:PAS domain S-box-containing protein